MILEGWAACWLRESLGTIATEPSQVGEMTATEMKLKIIMLGVSGIDVWQKVLREREDRATDLFVNEWS